MYNRICLHWQTDKFHTIYKSEMNCNSANNITQFLHFVTFQPEDAKEAARDVLARAQAKGLLSGKKARERKPALFDEQNGEMSDTTLTNGHATDASKLLSRRSRKVDRKLPARGPNSAPSSGVVKTSYTKPDPSSPIHKYIHTPIKTRQQNGQARNSSTTVTARLYNTNRRSSEEMARKPKIAEHIKVVKHPAPFR